VGRASWGSSFLDDPGATFFCGKREWGTKKEKSSKKERTEGLWKLTLLMGIRKERGFPQQLEKSLAKDARLFHSSHRPNNKDLSIMYCRQRSTLRRPDFGPKDGEHLTVHLSLRGRDQRPEIRGQTGKVNRTPKDARPVRAYREKLFGPAVPIRDYLGRRKRSFVQYLGAETESWFQGSSKKLLGNLKPNNRTRVLPSQARMEVAWRRRGSGRSLHRANPDLGRGT